MILVGNRQPQLGVGLEKLMGENENGCMMISWIEGVKQMIGCS